MSRRVWFGATAGAVAVVVAVAVTVLVLLGGGGKPKPGPTTQAAGRDGGTFRMAFGSEELDAIDPSHIAYSVDAFVAKQLYTGLTQAQPDGTVQNKLATSLTPDATCANWQIKMKTGTTFSDGSPVTPDSFILGWTRAVRAYKALDNSSYLFSNLKGYSDIISSRSTTLSGVQKDGSDGLEVALVKPDCDFGKRLSNPVYAPLPTQAGSDPENKSFNAQPIGNGPFKVSSYLAKSKLTLVRNNSWAFGRARLDQVEIGLATVDAQAQIQQFLAGELDWVPLARADLAANAHPSRGSLVTGESNGVDYLTTITDRAPFNSVDARLAVSYALDRTSISKLVYGGLQAPALSVVPPTIPGYPHAGACPSCAGPDAVKAKEHAQKAGMGAGARITLNIINRPLDTKMAGIIQHQLQTALGWRVTLRPRPITDYYGTVLVAKDISGGLYLTPWTAGDVPAAADFLYQQLGSEFAKVGSDGKITSNFSRYHDGRFDALIAKASATPDDKTRDGLVHQAEGIVLNEMPIIPLIYFTPVRLADTSRFVTPRLDPDGDLVLSAEALK